MARYSVTVLGGITGETLENLSHLELNNVTDTLRDWFPTITLEVAVDSASTANEEAE